MGSPLSPLSTFSFFCAADVAVADGYACAVRMGGTVDGRTQESEKTEEIKCFLNPARLTDRENSSFLRTEAALFNSIGLQITMWT